MDDYKKWMKVGKRDEVEENRNNGCRCFKFMGWRMPIAAFTGKVGKFK